MTAAIVELDALADAVRPPAENDDLLRLCRPRLARRDARERRLVSRIHIGRGRGELGRAGIDALIDRVHVERPAFARDLARLNPGERAEPLIGKTHRLQCAELSLIAGKA